MCSKPWVGKAERFYSIQVWHPLQLSGLGPKTKSFPSAILAFPQISPDSSSVAKVASSPSSVVKVKVLLPGWSRNSKTTSAISRDELRRASGSGRTRVQEMLNCVFQGDTINAGQNVQCNSKSLEVFELDTGLRYCYGGLTPCKRLLLPQSRILEGLSTGSLTGARDSAEVRESSKRSKNILNWTDLTLPVCFIQQVWLLFHQQITLGVGTHPLFKHNGHMPAIT